MTRWWDKMKNLWHSKVHRSKCADPSAREALRSASERAEQARQDWSEAMSLRVKAEEAAASVRAHNTSNRYDDWLREVMRNG